MGKITCNARSHVNLRTFSDFESERLNSLKILFNAFNYDYSPTSSLHTPDVDLLGVVGGIPEEDADRPTSPPSAVSGLLLDTAARSA